jgi:hypothetical protein
MNATITAGFRPVVVAAAALVIISFVYIAPCGAPPGAAKPATLGATADSAAHSGYRIDQPGTITFTVGVVIKGKVDKPQVMIFLPKEKPFFREFKPTHSFADDLRDPLPFEPLLE